MKIRSKAVQNRPSFIYVLHRPDYFPAYAANMDGMRYSFFVMHGLVKPLSDKYF